MGLDTGDGLCAKVGYAGACLVKQRWALLASNLPKDHQVRQRCEAFFVAGFARIRVVENGQSPKSCDSGYEMCRRQAEKCFTALPTGEREG